MITKEAVNKENYKKPILFTNSARTAFRIILHEVFRNSTKKILMPSYIGETDKEGSGVFDPVRQTKTPFSFYKIKKDLSADISDIRYKIETGEYKAVLIIHYFGFVRNNILEIYDLCKKNNVFLIEDCAHSFHSKHNNTIIGNFGDFAFFSVHKIIPTANGGILKINNPDTVFDTKLDQNDLISYEDLNLYSSSDYDAISMAKVNNYKYYLKHWKHNSLVVPLYKRLPSGIVPLNFPVIINKDLREKIYFKLIDENIITCSLYYRMINEISRSEYPISYEISANILNFPVHQDTDFDDIDLILEKLSDICNFYQK